MEYENKYANRGVGNTALGLSIGAVAAEVLGGGLGGILGNTRDSVSKSEAAKDARIAQLETDVKFRDASIYTDQKVLDLYKYVDGEIKAINAQLCQQSVVNAQVTANIACLQNNVNTLMGLTKTIIPIDNVCPNPMPRYNSFVTPTTGTTT